MTPLSELRRQTAERLLTVSGESARFDADLLIEQAYGIELKQFDRLSDTDLDPSRLEPLVERRLNGEPTQYILGMWEFYGLPFYVGDGVLIPRPDTEVLVEKALEAIADIPLPRVLDLCAGSGCISIAIKKQRPDAEVCAVELYDAALGYLGRNIKLNGTDIKVRRFDVLAEPNGFDKYDLIISNPPYIDSGAMTALPDEVRREPHTALFGGEDGLDFYRAIAERWCPLLTDDGCVALEIGYDQAERVKQILQTRSMTADVYPDYGGNDRVIIGTRRRIQ